ncbi:MAG: type VI secretion system protein TssA [Deltaproteobacteria bacterium]|nr:type VI secretion system protein TssA [Deltaproteobacteria bacterium]
MFSETAMNEKTMPLTIDLEKLLSPISIERPAGESLRYEGTYDDIQEARREDDPNLPQGIWEAPLKKADWRTVQDLCLEALETRSKDLQIAVWLLEAWLHLHGFSGVREGVKLLIGLCESFWDNLYPELDEDDFEYRLGPIEWMNEKLFIKLKQIPITQPKAEDEAPYTWVDRDNALRLENLAREDQAALESAEVEGKVTLAQFRGSIMLSPKSFYVTLSEELNSTIDTVATFERLLDEKCGNKAPSFGQFKGVLMDIQRLVSDTLKEREEEEEPSVSEADEDTQIAAWVDEQETENISVGDSIRSRAEAYQMLSEAADYLLKTEPHSPVPYLIKRAVAWGSMTLTELLQELVSNDSDLQAMYTLLGMKEGGDE